MPEGIDGGESSQISKLFSRRVSSPDTSRGEGRSHVIQVRSKNTEAGGKRLIAVRDRASGNGGKGEGQEPHHRRVLHKNIAHRALNFLGLRPSEDPAEKHPLPDLRSDNLELLHNAGEVGESLVPYYEYALRLNPDLSNVRIIRDDESVPYAQPNFEDGRHVVVLPFSHDSPSFLRDKISDSALALIAESLDMTPEALAQRPDLLHVHAALHEIGHTDQYKQYENTPEDFNERQIQEINNLPVPGQASIGVLRNALSDENSSQSKWVRDNWDELQKKYGIQNIQDLLDVQSVAKRKMFQERYADEFAVRVIKGLEHERARADESAPVAEVSGRKVEDTYSSEERDRIRTKALETLTERAKERAADPELRSTKGSRMFSERFSLDGRDFIVLKAHREATSDSDFEERAFPLERLAEKGPIPDGLEFPVIIDRENQIIVCESASGKYPMNLTAEEVRAITDQQLETVASALEYAGSLGLKIDHKPDNLFVDRVKGIQIVDLAKNSNTHLTAEQQFLYMFLDALLITSSDDPDGLAARRELEASARRVAQKHWHAEKTSA